MSHKILIIEDEVKIARVIALELEFEGCIVETVHDGLQGYDVAISGSWDLILLDIMIPGLNGLEVLRRIRAQDEQTPVILLTARDTVPDKVSGLDLGANDYITKPFQIEELLARIRACIRTRQAQQPSQPVLQIADLIIDEKLRQVRRSAQAIELTKREFDLLWFLVQHNNQALSREQILEAVWGFTFEVDTNVVDVYIRYLRKKIDEGFDSPLIHTVRGVGYSLREPAP